MFIINYLLYNYMKPIFNVLRKIFKTLNPLSTFLLETLFSIINQTLFCIFNKYYLFIFVIITHISYVFIFFFLLCIINWCLNWGKQRISHYHHKIFVILSANDLVFYLILHWSKEKDTKHKVQKSQTFQCVMLFRSKIILFYLIYFLHCVSNYF